jgi:hypothetical protein
MLEERDHTLSQGVFTLGGNWRLLRFHRLLQIQLWVLSFSPTIQSIPTY